MTSFARSSAASVTMAGSPSLFNTSNHASFLRRAAPHAGTIRGEDNSRRGQMTEVSTLQFLGAAGTVTGSKHLVRAGGRQLLLDCGMFQGLKDLRLRNWRKPPFDANAIDAVVLSHAHIDHSGGLPLLVRHGFRGPIYCTPASADLLPLLLRDAANLQEEEAEHANRHGYSKHKPALPLYTVQDAEKTLRLVEPQPYGQRFPVTDEFA